MTKSKVSLTRIGFLFLIFTAVLLIFERFFILPEFWERVYLDTRMMTFFLTLMSFSLSLIVSMIKEKKFSLVKTGFFFIICSFYLPAVLVVFNSVLFLLWGLDFGYRMRVIYNFLLFSFGILCILLAGITWLIRYLVSGFKKETT